MIIKKTALRLGAVFYCWKCLENSRAGPSGNGTPGGRQFFPPGGGDQQEAPRTGGRGQAQAQPAQKTPPAQEPEGAARRRSHWSGGPVSRAPAGARGTRPKKINQKPF